MHKVGIGPELGGRRCCAARGAARGAARAEAARADAADREASGDAPGGAPLVEVKEGERG